MLYVDLVTPHLDYDVSVWNPFLQKDLDIMEKVQNKATRMSLEMKGLSSYNRLSLLG